MSAATAVAAGRRLLNRDFPGWEKFIDVDDLNLGSHRSCVLGQLAQQDQRMADLIDRFNDRRREDMVRDGWDPLDVRPMPRDFFSACIVLGFNGRAAEEYGFDFNTEITLDALQDEWLEVIGDELGKWESKEES